MSTAKKILIIVPALNEGRVIKKLVKEIRAQSPAFTVLVVNDGSSDDTALQAEEAGARLVTLPYNLGIGGAVQVGYQIATDEDFDITVQIDGDGQHDPHHLADILAPVISGELDLCIGSRFLTDRSGFQSTVARRAGIRFFSGLLRLVTGLSISDPTSGFRATSKRIIHRFAYDYPIDFPEPEAIIMARNYGAKIGEVPVRMRKRLGGISSIRYFKTVYYMIKVTLAILIDTLKKKD